MSKDPAFLFYSQDFISTTLTMSHEDRGKFILLLAMMHRNGRLTEESIRIVVGIISKNLSSKFSIDEKNLWYNERLESEIEKRSVFTDSRRKNGALGGRPNDQTKPNGKPIKKPKSNHTEDEIEDVIKDINNENLKLKWVELFKTEKWCKKSIKTLRATVEKSNQYDVDFMLKLIDSSICGEYQGLYFPNTDSEYTKHKKLLSNTGQKHIKDIVYSEPD